MLTQVVNGMLAFGRIHKEGDREHMHLIGMGGEGQVGAVVIQLDDFGRRRRGIGRRCWRCIAAAAGRNPGYPSAIGTMPVTHVLPV